jgi:adenosyl cobinamide kinase/adenosyl cobinamide phosphate guanylyltransferase
MKDAGFADHLALVASLLPEIAPAFAQRGDVAAVGDALGVVDGEMIFVLREDGLGLVPLTAATRAFRI